MMPFIPALHCFVNAYANLTIVYSWVNMSTKTERISLQLV